MKKETTAVITMLALSLTALAQQPITPKPTPKPHLALWQWDDGALIGSMAADEISTRQALNRCATCYEAGAIKQPLLRIAVKGGIVAAFKFYERRHPESRGKTKWAKLAFAAVFSLAAANNWKRAR